MPAEGLRKRPRDFVLPNLPFSNKRKCPRCNDNLPMDATNRQAHVELCAEISDATSSEAEEEGDELFVDDGTCIVDEVRSEPEEQEDLHAWIEALAERGTLSPDHMLKYMNWGPLPLSEQEKDVAEFLGTMTSGVGVSTTKMNKILKFWNKKNGPGSLPECESKCWQIIEDAHARMTAPLHKRSVTVEIPLAVQELLTEAIPTITWEFWNPCDLLIRMLTMGPLSAISSAFALNPVESEYLDDFCHGEKMKRICAALPRNTSPLSCILFFDALYLDKKGYTSGEGAIVVGAFFNKEARNSTYAKASFGTFPQLNVPKVVICGLCLCSVATNSN